MSRSSSEGEPDTSPPEINSSDPEMSTKRAPAQKKSIPFTPPESSPHQPVNALRQVMWSRPGFLVRRLLQIADALYFEECHTKNLTPVQFGVLTALSMNPWLDQKGIGRELALDRTTIAEVLKRLEEKGLIERRVDPDDRRSRLSAITKQGLKLIRSLEENMRRSQQRLLEPLSGADRAVFMKLISEVVHAHENMDSPA